MKREILITVLLATVLNIPIFAQKKDSVEVADTASSQFFNGKFFRNWSIGLGGGASLFLGEEDHLGALGKHITPFVELSMIKRATPVIAFRGVGSYGAIHSWALSSVPGHAYDGTLYLQKMKMFTAEADAMFDITNAFWGYRPKRKLSVLPYLGVGATWPWNDDVVKRELTFPLGVYLSARLCDKLDLTFDFKHIFVNPRQNNIKIDGKLYEGMVNVSIGLSYRIGKQGLHRYVKADNLADLYAENANLRNNNLALQSENKALKAAPVPVPVAVHDTLLVDGGGKYYLAPLMLCFKIDDAVLSDQELARLDYYMNYVKEYIPDYKDKRVKLIGSADKYTGNARINQDLSERRAKALRKVLMKKFDIPSDNIEMDFQGDRNNIFEAWAPNRAVYFKIEFEQ